MPVPAAAEGIGFHPKLVNIFLSSLSRAMTLPGSSHPLALEVRAEHSTRRSRVLTDMVEWASTSPYRGQHREFESRAEESKATASKAREVHISYHVWVLQPIAAPPQLRHGLWDAVAAR